MIEHADPTPYALEMWATFEAMIDLMKPQPIPARPVRRVVFLCRVSLSRGMGYNLTGFHICAR